MSTKNETELNTLKRKKTKLFLQGGFFIMIFLCSIIGAIVFLDTPNNLQFVIFMGLTALVAILFLFRQYRNIVSNEAKLRSVITSPIDSEKHPMQIGDMKWENAVFIDGGNHSMHNDNVQSETGEIVVGGKVMSIDETVDLLIAICNDCPKGIWPDSKEEKLIKEIGKAVNKAGGMKLMLNIHEQFAIRNRWLARSLESTWGGIGDWRA